MIKKFVAIFIILTQISSKTETSQSLGGMKYFTLQTILMPSRYTKKIVKISRDVLD